MDESCWLEVSIAVDGELAEAVAEVLSRYIPSGVVIESTAVTADEDDGEGRPVGFLRVFGYLRMDGAQGECNETGTHDIRQKIEESLWYMSRIRPLPPAEFRIVQEADWAEAWKQHYHPVVIGSKFVIVPAWMENPDQARTEIRMDPGMAFGTGTHPTTQLCLEFIEELVNPGMNVIDIGCGSGILSVGALKLGAAHALAVDIDADAVRVTRENGVLNGVSASLEFGLGSVDEVLSQQYSITSAPLVLANILAPVLVRLLDDGLGDLVQPGGNLVLSGIIETQAEDVRVSHAQERDCPLG